MINTRQQKYLTLKVLLSLKYSLHPSRGTNSFMKYRYITRIAAGIILIMATVFINNAIAIYQFSQQDQT
ncbi:YdcF family protein, partial [Salmonella sp. 741265076_HSA]